MAEHEWNSGNDMSGMSEEEAVAAAMGVDSSALQQQPPAQEPPQAPAAEQPVQQPTDEIPSDLAASLLEALGPEAETTQPEAPAPTSTIDADRLKELDTLFNDTLGFSVSEAVEKMQSFNQESAAVMTSITEASNHLALQMQELELKQAWMNDPSVQGQNLNQVVKDRVSQLSQVYQKLDEPTQKRLAAAGSQGILTLWELTNRGKAPVPQQQVPQGRANIAPGSSAQPQAASLSQVVSLKDEKDFWKAMEGIQQGQTTYTDDIGARRSRR